MEHESNATPEAWSFPASDFLTDELMSLEALVLDRFEDARHREEALRSLERARRITEIVDLFIGLFRILRAGLAGLAHLRQRTA